MTEVNLGGAPPKFESPDAMALAIEGYLSNLPKKRVVIGGVELDVEVMTITGLCLHIGFESRQSFYDYEKRDGFSYIIKRARLFIEQGYESQLHHGNTTGAIFALKNMGWTDRLDTNVTATLSNSDMTEDQLNAKLKALLDADSNAI